MRIFYLAIIGGIAAATWPSFKAGEADPEEGAKVVAAAMDAITPKDMGGGLTMTDVRADGKVVAMRFDGLPESELLIPDFDRQVTSMVCGDPGFRRAIDKDLDIRIEFGEARSIDVTGCS